MDLVVIPECYIDTNLIETIAPPRKGYNHQKGCGTVTRLMQTKLIDGFALGIIDRDKHEVKYLEEFDVVIDKTNLKLHKHRNKHHYIIQIAPAIEQFILECSTQANLNILDYGFPSDIPSLTKITKKETSKENKDFKRFFKAIKNGNSESIQTLIEWIEYLKAHPYNCDLGYLKTL